MSLLFIIILIFLVLILMIPSMILSFIYEIVSLFRGKKSTGGATSDESGRYSSSQGGNFHNVNYSKKQKKSKKIFDKDEGEYIDFEETK